MQKFFERPVLLPSNGIEYNKLVYLRQPTLELLFFNSNEFFNYSNLERTISFIKKYSNIDDPTSLYSADFFYIWSLFYAEYSKVKQQTHHCLDDSK